jgi:hypothetical protein
MVAVAGPNPRPGGTSVVTDNRGGAAQAVRHLLDHGHRRIGFVGAFTQEDIKERYLGYRSALREAGIEPDPALVYRVGNELSPGREAVQAILGRTPPSAIFAGTDRQALDLLAGFAEAGVMVPDDIAVIGFDDSQAAQTTVPALSSIRQIPGELGSTAVDLLLDVVNGVPGAEGRHVLPTTLVERHSCGCFETEQGFIPGDHDWTAPDWKNRLAELLELALVDSPGFSPGAHADVAWSGVETVIEAFDSAVQGIAISNVTELDEAWHSACSRTRNAETLLGLVDLLEYVGLCRQARGIDIPGMIRPKLRSFLNQARLQILRYCAIVDPFHTLTSELEQELTRTFLNPKFHADTDLGWLAKAHAIRACLCKWEPAGDGRVLRVTASYGASAATAIAGTRLSMEDFPPADWIGGDGADSAAATVTILPIGSPTHAWGVLAAILPREHRYFDDYWALQHGTSLMSILLERDAAA